MANLAKRWGMTPERNPPESQPKNGNRGFRFLEAETPSFIRTMQVANPYITCISTVGRKKISLYHI
jgi:hypothetical protein